MVLGLHLSNAIVNCSSEPLRANSISEAAWWLMPNVFCLRVARASAKFVGIEVTGMPSGTIWLLNMLAMLGLEEERWIVVNLIGVVGTVVELLGSSYRMRGIFNCVFGIGGLVMLGREDCGVKGVMEGGMGDLVPIFFEL